MAGPLLGVPAEHQFHEGRRGFGGVHPRRGGQLVDVQGRGLQHPPQGLQLCRWLRPGRRRIARCRGGSRRPQFLEHIGSTVHQAGAVAQQSVGPLALKEPGKPGTANTSRPCSRAQEAVIKEPLRSDASTTTTPWVSPLITRLRRGKWCRPGAAPRGNSLTQAPLLRTATASSACRGG